MKNYTDLEQSKKLAEILPIESADMFYRDNGIDVKLMWEHNAQKVKNPCWSLAALLAVLDEPYLFKKFNTWSCYVFDPNNHRFISTDLAEPVDTCYEMIIRLNELNLL